MDQYETFYIKLSILLIFLKKILPVNENMNESIKGEITRKNVSFDGMFPTNNSAHITSQKSLVSLFLIKGLGLVYNQEINVFK